MAWHVQRCCACKRPFLLFRLPARAAVPASWSSPRAARARTPGPRRRAGTPAVCPAGRPSPFLFGRHDALRGPGSRAARGEDLCAFRAAAAFGFGFDRPVRDVGDRAAVFGGLHDPAGRPARSTDRFDPRASLFRRGDELPRAAVGKQADGVGQRREGVGGLGAFRLFAFFVFGDHAVEVGGAGLQAGQRVLRRARRRSPSRCLPARRARRCRTEGLTLQSAVPYWK